MIECYSYWLNASVMTLSIMNRILLMINHNNTSHLLNLCITCVMFKTLHMYFSSNFVAHWLHHNGRNTICKFLTHSPLSLRSSHLKTGTAHYENTGVSGWVLFTIKHSHTSMKFGLNEINLIKGQWPILATF